MSTPHFFHRAPCRNEDPELFFPVGDTAREGSPAWRQAQQAKAVCANCPFVLECRDWAREIEADFGIWAGMTADERRALHRRRTKVSG